jgi:hypothetical protein
MTLLSMPPHELRNEESSASKVHAFEWYINQRNQQIDKLLNGVADDSLECLN